MSDKVQLTINGNQVEAQAGQTVLDVARENGIYIPTLCYHQRLGGGGACRLCMVDVEGVKNLVASCVYPVREGLVVQTDSEKVKAARRFVLELIIGDGYHDCLVCERDGDCELQFVAYSLGIDKMPIDPRRKPLPMDDTNPMLVRDHNRCILCGRCVIACNEVQYNGAIDFAYRSSRTKISAGRDQPLEESPCVFCGECVQVCPTGALVESKARFKGRAKELTRTRTICPYCGVGCQIILHTKGNQIVKVTGAEGVLPNNGSLCVKGRFGCDFVNHPDRLTKPLIRKDGGLVESTWDEALNLVASKLKETKEKYGPDSIGFLVSAKCTNEENYLMMKLARAVIGTNNVDHCARL